MIKKISLLSLFLFGLSSLVLTNLSEACPGGHGDEDGIVAEDVESES